MFCWGGGGGYAFIDGSMDVVPRNVQPSQTTYNYCQQVYGGDSIIYLGVTLEPSIIRLVPGSASNDLSQGMRFGIN